jgi:hypothetical protein
VRRGFGGSGDGTGWLRWLKYGKNRERPKRAIVSVFEARARPDLTILLVVTGGCVEIATVSWPLVVHAPDYVGLVRHVDLHVLGGDQLTLSVGDQEGDVVLG